MTLLAIPKKIASFFDARATSIASVFTAIAAISAILQYQGQIKLQREIAANQSWEGFSEIAMSEPEYADGTFDYGDGKTLKQISYRWYMERMLITGEQILRARPNDAQWTISLKTELGLHARYLDSKPFRGFLPTDQNNLDVARPRETTYCTYLEEFRRVLRSLILESQNSKYPDRIKEVTAAMTKIDASCPSDDEVYSNA